MREAPGERYGPGKHVCHQAPLLPAQMLVCSYPHVSPRDFRRVRCCHYPEVVAANRRVCVPKAYLFSARGSSCGKGAESDPRLAVAPAWWEKRSSQMAQTSAERFLLFVLTGACPRLPWLWALASLAGDLVRDLGGCLSRHVTASLRPSSCRKTQPANSHVLKVGFAVRAGDLQHLIPLSCTCRVSGRCLRAISYAAK